MHKGSDSAFLLCSLYTAAGYCQASDLGFPLELDHDRCRLSERAASIMNGVVCYTGTATGSLAYYICDDGYELNDLRGTFVNPRECLQNGRWSKPDPECTNEEGIRKFSPHAHIISVLLNLTVYKKLHYFLLVDVTTVNTMKPNGSILLPDESQIDVLQTCATSLGILGAGCFLVLFPAGIIIGAVVTHCCSLRKKTTTQATNPFYDYIGEPGIATKRNQSYERPLPEVPKTRMTVTSETQ